MNTCIGSCDANMPGICVGSSGAMPLGMWKLTSRALAPWHVPQVKCSKRWPSKVWNIWVISGITRSRMNSPFCCGVMSAHATCGAALASAAVAALASASAAGVAVVAPPDVVSGAVVVVVVVVPLLLLLHDTRNSRAMLAPILRIISKRPPREG
ncbi:MAG: hypothetical protein U0325_27325 [Polyangiales bacterium]